MAEAIRSRTETKRSSPATVEVRDHHDSALPVYRVVLNLARPLWIREDIGDGDVSDWYFEGWILSYGPGAITRVRIHVFTTGSGEFGADDMFTVQRFMDDEHPDEVSWP